MIQAESQNLIENRIKERREATTFTQRPPFPRNIMVELTNACNHKCIFCANPKMEREVGRIDPKLLTRVLGEAYRLGAREIGFYTTGDPLIHKDLPEFVREAKAIGFEYAYISTNGALASKERIQQIVDAGIDSVKFSINAGDRTTYALIHGRDDWDTVIKNLKYLSALRGTIGRELKLAITYVVTDQNRSQMSAFQDEMGPHVDGIYFSDCGVQGGNMLENGGILVEQPIKYSAPCSMVFNRAHITCEGFLTLCCVDYENYLAVCDLKTTKLEEAWNHPKFVEMRQKHLENELAGTLCYNCINLTQQPIEPLNVELAHQVSFETASSSNKVRVADRIAAQG
jgi:pyruvate-formate lyase-activating enzyme